MKQSTKDMISYAMNTVGFLSSITKGFALGASRENQLSAIDDAKYHFGKFLEAATGAFNLPKEGEEKRTYTIELTSVKNTDGWANMVFHFEREAFWLESAGEDEDLISDNFYEERISKRFEYGDFANLKIVFDEDYNIVGGRLLPK